VNTERLAERETLLYRLGFELNRTVLNSCGNPIICSANNTCLSFSVCREFGFIDDTKRDKNPTLNREVLCAECVRAMKTNCRLRETKRCLRTRQWLLHVADTREGGRAWRQARD